MNPSELDYAPWKVVRQLGQFLYPRTVTLNLAILELPGQRQEPLRICPERERRIIWRRKYIGISHTTLPWIFIRWVSCYIS